MHMILAQDCDRCCASMLLNEVHIYTHTHRGFFSFASMWDEERHWLSSRHVACDRRQVTAQCRALQGRSSRRPCDDARARSRAAASASPALRFRPKTQSPVEGLKDRTQEPFQKAWHRQPGLGQSCAGWARGRPRGDGAAPPWLLRGPSRTQKEKRRLRSSEQQKQNTRRERERGRGEAGRHGRRARARARALLRSRRRWPGTWPWRRPRPRSLEASERLGAAAGAATPKRLATSTASTAVAALHLLLGAWGPGGLARGSRAAFPALARHWAHRLARTAKKPFTAPEADDLSGRSHPKGSQSTPPSTRS